MQFKTLFTASLLSGLAVAAPTEEPCTTPTASQASGSAAPKAFGLIALRSASDIHFARFSASKGGFLLNLPEGKQGADCDGESDGYATFSLNADGELLLYSTGEEQQRAYTDRSGMGQGVLQYNNNGQGLPRNAETKPWKIDESGNLVFDNSGGFVACPNGPDNSWNVWVATGIERPGYSEKNCTGFSARVGEITKPVSCTYS
ncbi:hypothetical protein NW762_011656 [Fusarium torreyae]|uniref:Cell wall protein PhiA n=1 Tax=Fusarium torreyae TaxID=1237075 RepID=A0A9W8RSV0_9HYPO|nr:hypothetical protein NW762_011656 [Fusarium torreyae]